MSKHRAVAAPQRPASATVRGLRMAAGRLSWGLADQAVSSLTNFAVGVVVARGLGLTEFGVFSLAWLTYGVVINVARGLGTDPLVVRFSGVARTTWATAVSRTSGVALLVGVVTGAVNIILGLILGGSLGAAFVALGLVLPGLLLQDSWRFAFFAAGDGRKAFANDAVWAIALIPAMVVAGRFASVFAFVLAWGIAAAVAAAYGIVQTRVVPSPMSAGVWFQQQRDLGLRYVVENVSLSGAGQVRMYGLGAIAGLADVGAVRGAQLALGPLLAVLVGIGVFAVPEAARMLRRSTRRLQLFSLVLGAAQAAAALIWGLGLLLLLPDGAGQALLGAVWEPASALVLPVVLAVACASLSGGAMVGLRALGAARRSLRAQLFDSATHVIAGLVGAFLGGALGSCWGVALASAVSVVVWWTQLRAAVRESAAMTSDHEDQPATD